MESYTNRIVDDILYYLNDDRQTQAILIDGRWGYGKTFFIKNTIIPKINSFDDKKAIYISLYGVKEYKEITDEIYTNIICHGMDKEIKTTFKIAKTGLNLYNAFSDKKIEISEVIDSVKSTFDISDFLEISNKNIIILDDLERCSMGINEILGYINNLVEHNKLKVIIVANEEQIGRVNLNENLEAKYNVILSEKLDLEKKSDKTTSNKINIKELEKYTQDLFNTDLIYKSIKEKLIGLTIKFEPELDKLFDDIIEKNVINPNVKLIVDRNKDVLLNRIKENDNYNIRTIIFALISFEKIFEAIDKEKFEQKHMDKIINNICEYCMIASIYYKEGREITLYDKYRPGIKHIKEYSFVNEFLSDRFISNNMKDEIQNEINEYKNEERKELSLYKLYEKWWDLEDDQVDKYIIGLKKELEEDSYKVEEFKLICVLILQLEHNKFKNDELDNIKVIMVNKALEYDGDVNIYSLKYITTTTSEFETKYNELTKPIIDALEKNKVQKLIDFEQYIRTGIDDWGQKFYEYCYDNEQLIAQNNGFLKFIDMGNLIEVLVSSNNNNIYVFRDTVRKLYQYNSLRENDKDEINNFIKRLRTKKIKGRTKQIAIESLYNTLDEYK